MKTNLTENQQAIIDSVIAEFNKFNEPSSSSETNDLIEYINQQINAKEKFLREIRISNKLYDKANESQVNDIIEKLNALLNNFGYECKLDYVSNGIQGFDFAQHFEVKIYWNGHLDDYRNTDKTGIYFYSNKSHKEGIYYLEDSTIEIHKTCCKRNKIESVDELLKHVAQLIIAKKKSLIK